jgi:formyl-CoA transferase
MNIGAGGEARWQRLIKCMDAPELGDVPEFVDDVTRRKNRDMLNEALAEVFKTRTSDEWVEVLNDAGVPCGPIYALDETFADAQVKHLGMAVGVDHPTLGTIELVDQPVNLSRTPSSMRSATPELGEHTDAILADLGYDAATIADYRARNVI